MSAHEIRRGGLGMLEPVGFIAVPSPSPRPSPSGRGSHSDRVLGAKTTRNFECGLTFSLSQRERAGVRENGCHDLQLAFQHAVSANETCHLGFGALPQYPQTREVT